MDKLSNVPVNYNFKDCDSNFEVKCSNFKCRYKGVSKVIARAQACVLWPLNVLCGLDLWGMDTGQGHCTSINAYVSYSMDTSMCTPLMYRVTVTFLSMAPGQGHCTLSQWGQHFHQVRW